MPQPQHPILPARLSRVTIDAVQAMSIKYNMRVYEMQRRGVQVIVMSLGEAFFDIPLLPMSELPFPASYHYTSSMGLLELRQCLAKYFLSEYDVPVDPETEILVTAGSKPAIHMALMSVIDPGDEVLIHEPAWVSYPEQIRLCYGVPVSIPYENTVYDFEKFITPKTKAIIINNPNNPRGSVFSAAELEFLLSLARKHGLWLLSDEAYSDFLTDGSFVSLGKLDREKTHSIIFNTISKNYGVSGWRLGYVVGNKDLLFNVLKVNQHLLTCPASILQYYLARYFEDLIKITKPQIQAVVRKRQELARFMDGIGLTYLPGNATFYFFVSIEPSTLNSEEFATRLLDEEHISVVPGIGYGDSCGRFVRVSVGTATQDENRHGLTRIKALIDRTTKA